MKWREAIKKVLEDADEPVHYTEITQRIMVEGLRAGVGANPAATVAAQLSQPPLVKEVVRVEKGAYALARPDNAIAEPSPQPEIGTGALQLPQVVQSRTRGGSRAQERTANDGIA
ncbi:winged helix-turn-helix domain-containing protein [Nesterenkonia sp. YGD6]|uniref:winged helix-turn-helix domain-containing protein n=1 Tax=Nesterenkonia sp. YGD6 TaxID=2901231 RepID=UPI001F4CB6E7|nr:winged helix-turn-helix domain-containing protein [Nesterenkonia sp. YGD6]MCH8563700.1 winged helix-turn-helix domain-containing protein [Nesterenkonia sp. YGD6]